MSNPSDGRITFDNILNFRDVGAHINYIAGQEVLATGKLFRSARPDAASPADRQRLAHDLKIKTIIDLRTPTEQIEQARKAATVEPAAPAIAPKDPTKPLRIDGIDYKDINFNGDGYKNALMNKLSYWNFAKLVSLYALGYRKEAISILGTNVMAGRGLAGLAIDSLQHCQKEVKEVFDVLCDPTCYPVLVHCTQGKDRTGLIVLLALMLCQVNRDLARADYRLSGEELAPEREEKLGEIRSIGLPDSFADCPENWTEEVWVYIENNYATAGSYLETCGIAEQQRDQLIQLLGSNKAMNARS